MKRFQQKSFICVISIIFLITASAAPILANEGREEPYEEYSDLRAEEVVFDFVILRPLGLAATVLGTAFWVVISPFTVWGGNWGKTAQVLIYDPAAYTFTRPIGDIDGDCSYEDD